MSYIDEIKKGREERLAKMREREERLIEEERALEDAYVAAGLGYTIPTYHLGFRPACVEAHGGVFKVYRECIEKGIPWQVLCNWDPNNEPAGCNM